MAIELSENAAHQFTDQELVEAVLAGNQGRFSVLMERHQNAVFGYIYRLLNQDKETARDLTQTVFLKAYQSLASFDRNRPFPPWLYRIAHNETANHLRAHSRRAESRIDDAAWGRLASTSENSPEAHQAGADNSRIVMGALGRLKPKYREALMLYYHEEKSYQEIAEILNSNISTVGTLIRRALRQMRSIMESQKELLPP